MRNGSPALALALGALLLSALLTASRALAQEVDLALLPLPSASSSSLEAGRAMEPLLGALHRRGVGEALVLDPQVSRRAVLESSEGPVLGRAAALARSAREEMRAFEDLEGAAASLEEAAQSYLEVLPLLESVEVPFRLFCDLATVHLALGRNEEVETALTEAARLDPALPLDPEREPPRLIESAEVVRGRLDGSEEVTLSAALASHFATLLGAQHLAVGRLDRSGALLIELYEGQQGRRTLRLTLDEGEEPGRAAALLADAAGLSPSAPVEAPDEESEDRPWYRSWWFYTVLVLGVGAAVLGIVLGVNAADGED